jgi:hypothetical protein
MIPSLYLTEPRTPSIDAVADMLCCRLLVVVLLLLGYAVRHRLPLYLLTVHHFVHY